MTWSPTLSWEDAQKKSKILASIRAFFDTRGVVEVETPVMCRSSVTDIHLDPFITSFDHSPDNVSARYLQTSPEYAMKRLLASGYQSIYQLCKAFRNEQKGRYHNPEFTILEWYRVGFSMSELMSEVEQLVKQIIDCKDFTYITYQNLFIDYTGIDPLNTSIGEVVDYISRVEKMSDWLLEESKLDTLLQFILSEVIEPQIGLDVPCFIYNFPITQASLAKKSIDDPRVAERFELYYKGIELVNGFRELTNYEEQKERFENENIERSKLGLMQREIDERFLDSLKSGLPECSGVALGVDRLLMLALNKSTIDEVITFSIDRA